ncbi:MAG: family transposase [Bacteroidota bacterium]|jgi:REP element-mobilizing transposase RayT
MSHTISKVYIHLVFAVRYRRHSIRSEWEAELHRYITGIFRNKGQDVLAINGMPDHLHIFFMMRPTCILADLVREVKKASTVFINGKFYPVTKFRWQEGYGAFSYSSGQVDTVIRYIQNQKEHHQKKSFKEEYLEFLEYFQVAYSEEELSRWLDGA